MSELVTIATFQFENQAELAKGLLESEGIKAYIMDSITGTNYGANTVGGIKLQVRDRDVLDAARILNIDDYFLDRDDYYTGVPEGIQWVDQKTSAIPFLRKLPLLLRILVLMIIVASVIALLVNLFGK